MIVCEFENGGKGNLRHVVVHALVIKEGKILLVKRAPDLLEGGKWGLPGGFIDRDENAHEAVLRELLEETGWEGEIKTLFRINTNPFRKGEDRQNIVLEFLIEPIQKTGNPDKESSEIKWFSEEETKSLDFAFDHKETVELFFEHTKKKKELSIME